MSGQGRNIPLVGCRRATFDDAIAAFRRVDDIAREFGYKAGLHGSTLLRGEGNDIDLIVVPGDETTEPSNKVASAVVKRMAKLMYAFEELDDEAASIAVSFKQGNKTVVDIYFVGLPEVA